MVSSLFLGDQQSVKTVQVMIKCLKGNFPTELRYSLTRLFLVSITEFMTWFWQQRTALLQLGVQMAMKSNNVFSGRWPSSLLNSPEERDFSGKMQKTLFITASSRDDWDIDQWGNAEALNVKVFGDDNFPALGPNCPRQSHVHHSVRT